MWKLWTVIQTESGYNLVLERTPAPIDKPPWRRIQCVNGRGIATAINLNTLFSYFYFLYFSSITYIDFFFIKYLLCIYCTGKMCVGGMISPLLHSPKATYNTPIQTPSNPLISPCTPHTDLVSLTHSIEEDAVEKIYTELINTSKWKIQPRFHIRNSEK